MKKLVLFLCVLSSFSVAVFSGCKNENPLISRIVELRENIYSGEVGDFKFTAYYGFSEYPKEQDGTLGNKRYSLCVALSGGDNNVEYRVSFSHNGKDYSGTFALEPVKNELSANFFIDDFAEKSFTIAFGYSDKVENVTLTSIVPEGVANYKEIISSVYEKQTAFFESLTVNGEISAEITLRILVRDGKAYYYVGVAKTNYLKAFLVDAKTKELLAIREIMQ